MTRLKACYRVCLLCLPALLLGCGGPEPVAEQRTIIIGFDGMDYQLTRQMVNDGKLPNFKKLAEQGYFGPLATTVPPQSPVAWSSFATGTTPGHHGIYDFLRRDPQTYQPEFSIAETKPPESYMPFFGLQIPLDSGQIINRRQGQPFWSAVEQRGDRATVFRVPVTYPPDEIHRMFSGMGIPDLLGTQGTYTYISAKPISGNTSNGNLIRVRPDRTGQIETQLPGPQHPLKREPQPLTVPVTINPDGESVTIVLGDHQVSLQPGQWSEWLDISFSFFLFSELQGMVRLHLIETYPDLQLYVTPIHINPHAPAIPITSPPGFASEFADSHGPYHTIGMPEETWSLNSGHLSDAAFLDVIKDTLAEREAMFFETLEKQDSELVISVFVQTDRVSHMFYRGIDPAHPLYPETDELARGAIAWIYQEADRILGKTMAEMRPNDELIVLSDHGFAPFRRAVNLNRWLVDQGLMSLKPGASVDTPGFDGVDWQNTKAYAIGLNGIYLNLQGREGQGIVTEQDAESVLQTIRDGLSTFNDDGHQSPVVKTIYNKSDIYQPGANGDAPDLVVGYHPGYRASWQTAVGAIGAERVTDNLDKWSGDHCIAADEVPGIVLMSNRQQAGLSNITQIANWVLHQNTSSQ